VVASPVGMNATVLAAGGGYAPLKWDDWATPWIVSSRTNLPPGKCRYRDAMQSSTATACGRSRRAWRNFGILQELNMRVAHIITGLAADGAETMLYKLLRTMDGTQFDPLVVSLGGRGPTGARIEELGVPVFCCGMRTGVPSPMAAVRMIRRLRDFRPDLLQGWMYTAIWLRR